MTEENSFISVKCGPEVTAALCARFFFFFFFAASALSERLAEAAVAQQRGAGSSAQISECIPQGARDSQTLSG